MRAKSLPAVALLFSLAAIADGAEPVVSLPITELIASPARPIALAPDGSWVAFSGSGGLGDRESAPGAGRVQVWSLKSGTLDRSFLADEVWRQEGVAVSPDGRWLAHNRHSVYQSEILIRDFRTGKLTHTIRERSVYFPIGFSADGKELFTSAHVGNPGMKVFAWSTAGGTKLREIAFKRYERVTLAPDGKTALVEPRRGDGQELWDLATGKKLADLGRDSRWRQPTFLRGGKELALLFDRNYPVPDYVVWEVGAEKKPTTVKLSGKAKDPIRYAISDDLSITAILEHRGNLHVYDAGKAEPRFTFATKARHGEGPLFTPDGKRIILVDPHERVWVLDTATGKPALTLAVDYRSVKALAFTADGKSLVAGVAHWPKQEGNGHGHPDDGFLLTWNAATGELKRACGHTDNYLDAVFPTPDGAKAIVITQAYANQAEWWDLKAGKRLKVLTTPDDGASHFGASPDGKKVGATHYRYEKTPDGGRAGYLQDVWLWDPTTGERLPDITAKSDVRVSFTPDGRTALVRDGRVQAVRTGRGKPVALWKGTDSADTTRRPEEPVILPDGESFVAYHTPRQYGPRDLYIYDIGRQIKFGTADVYTGPIAISPDGKWVAVGGRVAHKPNPVYLWKLPELGRLDETQLKPGKLVTAESLAKRVTLEGHMGEVFALAFSPDGKTLATGGRDKIIRLWDVQTGKLKASLWAAPPADPTAAPSDWVAFTPEGFHAGTARGRAFLRFKVGDGAKLHDADKVRATLTD